MRSLPTGTVTFLFADIERSTELLQLLGDDRYAQVLKEYRRLLRSAFHAGGGHEIDTQGDGFLIAFQRAGDAVTTAFRTQLALQAHLWPDGAMPRVRMGLHTGEPVMAADGYVGLDVHRAARICAAGWGGQILISQTTRDIVEPNLPPGQNLRDLGLHTLKDLARREHLFQLLAPDLTVDFPPLRSLEALPHNLPVQLARFVGREHEIEEIRHLLTTTRLLTLTGVGGCGKTRLALQLAADIVDRFKDGAWLVELAALTEPDLLLEVIASAIGFHPESAHFVESALGQTVIPQVEREQKRQFLQGALAGYLERKRLLMIWDNCEHLIGTCAELAEYLLRAAPHLQILVTSREPLEIEGELSYPVSPLSLPDPRTLSFDYIIQSEAVRLFIERATSIEPGFRVPDVNIHAISQICRELDGLPLAIELAAARVKVLSVQEIAARLNDRFRLLTHGRRTALPRHRTLQSAIDWSYDLLSERERGALYRLSVFAGGFTLEAAEAICAHGGVEPYEVLDLLTQLVGKSLIAAEARNDHTRYRFLETIRQYAQDRLRESGEEATLRHRHADWFLALASRAEPELRGRDQEAWLERLDRDHDNLRSALDWCLKGGDTELGIRLAGALGIFWVRRGYLTEGLRWVEHALSKCVKPDELRLKVIQWAAQLAKGHFDFGRAAALGEEFLALSRALGEKTYEAFALDNLGDVAAYRGDHARAVPLYEQSLALFREIGSDRGVSIALADLSYLAWALGDFERAAALSEEALALARKEGDTYVLAAVLAQVGRLAHSRGDHKQATAAYEESLMLQRSIGARSSVIWSLNRLGRLARHQGNYERARALHSEALSLAREMGHKPNIMVSLQRLASVALAEGDVVEAVRLSEESLALSKELRNEWGAADACHILGIVALHQGAFGRAEALLQECVSFYRPRGNPQAIIDLAALARRQGNYEKAAELAYGSIHLQKREHKRGFIDCLEEMAAIAAAQSQHERAARLFGAADALRENVGSPRPPLKRADYENNVDVIRKAMGDPALGAAWAEGREMSIEQIMEYALKPSDKIGG